MSVGVLLITHPGVGSAMLHIASRIVDGSKLTVKCLEVPPDVALKPMCEHARTLLNRLDHGSGVLVLTDLFGATPHNIASELACDNPTMSVLSGLNLPMLLRVFNYPNDDLDALASKAAEGGSRGITTCPIRSADDIQATN